jgi:hypothetical protein
MGWQLIADGPNTDRIFKSSQIPARFSQECAWKLVGVRGFEPRTSSVSRKRSPPELYALARGASHFTAQRQQATRCRLQALRTASDFAEMMP